MYVEMAGEEDKKMAESWKADADGILVFTGLFSAAVAALIAVSIQDLKQNSQDTSAFYLANIYQLLANANGSHVSIPSTLPDPSQFSPPVSAIWVNSLWFLSLAISLTCAMLATLLQQWARRYVKVTQPRYSPHKRARIRAFFAEGVDKLHLPWAVEALPTLLHLSLFLFFAGLVIFLFNVNHTVFKIVMCWVGICTGLYICVTLMPIFRHDSPYYAPLSESAWFLYAGTLLVTFQILRWFAAHDGFTYATWDRFGDLRDIYRRWCLQGRGKAAEESAQKLSSEIDGRALTWTLESLDEDHELEQFFGSIPGFCNSLLIPDPLRAFSSSNGEAMSQALIGLMHRTLTSHFVSETVKERRVITCKRAMNVASLPINWAVLEPVLYREWDGLLSSVEFGHFLRRVNYNTPFTDYYARCIVSVIIARAKEQEDHWFELATEQFGISKAVLQSYSGHGDSILLASLIDISRRMIRGYSDYGWTIGAGWRFMPLKSVSRFNVHDTVPRLQHDFCSLWNEVVQMAQNSEDDRIQSIAIVVLRHIRCTYIALHQGMDTSAPTAFSASTADENPILISPSSYPLCSIESHRHTTSDSTSYTPEVIVGLTKNEIYPPTSKHDSVIATDPPSTSAFAPLLSAPGLDPDPDPALGNSDSWPPSDSRPLRPDSLAELV
ncbi:hypothetical protein B0F90DRAFT_633069 [Multifurca ochricompacta]|uniref:DUF6535 domain-containing protein n=1 Tax=Multifurca ochricompacta TaxID=376703 RepID=A0AAD4M270_9AGAM|nr:hypothetical protein B0F90DRAFT_633069 [Multifurca ochricompacta]